MNKDKYKELYRIQDKVFDIVFSFENDFYLTGGTCLSRFYWEKRYSDDLDFFATGFGLFGITVRDILDKLAKNISVKIEVESRDFIRLIVADRLRLDFVNDRLPRYKEVIVLENGYRIDNPENILSNKITAVMGRDNSKDIFDIYLISKFRDFSWKDIIQSAKKKLIFNIDDLVFRLKSFPVRLMEKINLADPAFLDNFDNEFPIIIEDIINERRNSMYKGS